MRVLTWNVQHANPIRSFRQVAWIAAQAVDAVILTEVGGAGACNALARSLGEHGFNVCCSPAPGGYQTMVASRIGSQEPCLHIRTALLPHRFVAVRLHFVEGPTAGLLGVYVPSRGSRERRNVDKREFQNSVTKLLPRLADLLTVDGPIVIAGDLNVVEPDHQPHYGVFGRWEYDFYDAFGRYGYGDAFRYLHPDLADYSWFGRAGNGYRFDHIFCSRPDAVRDCRYLHEPRITGLSDHSAMIATISVSPLASAVTFGSQASSPDGHRE